MPYQVVFTATYDWLQIAYPGTGDWNDPAAGGINWNTEPIKSSEWDDVCDIVGFDPNDEEVGFAVLETPRDCDTILRPGDVVATQGYGAHVVFLREVSL